VLTSRSFAEVESITPSPCIRALEHFHIDAGRDEARSILQRDRQRSCAAHTIKADIRYPIVAKRFPK
jgi:hypothetical protein